jgi:uncharacterized membrane protein
MSKGRRKSKINKLPRDPRILSPSPKTRETALLPSNMAKLRPERTVATSKEISIVAPAELCFKILASQLEQPPGWDPLIVDTQPVSNARGRIGATSQVTLDLGGKKVESQATISRYRPNRTISWVFTTRPRLREDWVLEQKPRGTVVRVTFAYEVPGWVIRRFLYKIRHWKKVEQDLDTTLTQLKAAAESTSRDQSGIGKSKL